VNVATNVAAASFLQVRFAKNNQFVAAGAGPPDNRQLFFTSAPRNLSEEDLTSLFSTYGVVEEVTLFKERKTEASKGCGFVTMATREAALKALQALGGADGQVGCHLPAGVTFCWTVISMPASASALAQPSSSASQAMWGSTAVRS
jgi:hypothetical protein